MRIIPPLLCLAALLAAPLASASVTSTYQVKNRRIEPRQTLAQALHDAALPDAQVEAVISALEGVFDFRKSRPGGGSAHGRAGEPEAGDRVFGQHGPQARGRTCTSRSSATERL
jgi:hypothetical protein